jgi:hypothetical protein
MSPCDDSREATRGRGVYSALVKVVRIADGQEEGVDAT